MSWVLESKDYRVMRALEPEAAVEAVIKKNFDLIIAKLTPEENEVLEVLKWARRLNPGVKIMAISRPQDQPFPREAYHIDMDDYILLPLSAGELWRRVSKCLEQASGADPKTGAASLGPAGEDWAARSLGTISDNLKSSLIATLGAVKLILQGEGGEGVAEKLREVGVWLRKLPVLWEEVTGSVTATEIEVTLCQENLAPGKGPMEPVIKELQA
jgi:DNA-binding response OmpR family regulator